MKNAIATIFVGAFGIAMFLGVIGGFIWAMAAITDANLDCPSNSIVQYNNFGYKSSCTTYPPPAVYVHSER